MVRLSSAFCLLMIVPFVFGIGAVPNECEDTWCGPDGPPIRFPFQLKGSNNSMQCGYPGFDILSCTPDKETVLELPLPADPFPARLYVHDIDYKAQKFLVNNPKEYCLSTQLLKLAHSPSPLFQYYPYDLTFFNCSLSSSPCPIRVVYSETDVSTQVSCTKMRDVLLPGISAPQYQGYFSTDIYYRDFFQISWTKPNCTGCQERGQKCQFIDNEVQCISKKHKGLSIKVKIALGSILLVMILIAIVLALRAYKVRKDFEAKIEKFLEDYKALKPSRYSYADIKKITSQFKENLGEGAYGTVYKGKLSNEILVAVKILHDSKGKGEEFINEVGTMGTIHHVNVVRLVGFCADGFYRALVYEFLPNESLEKFICPPDMKICFLGWEKLQHIALGIAKGLEYLHQGCEQQILHFDIKPRNILLDQNFSPKISDFGLAKLCSKDQSAVSMTTARGTIGYIAPEVFSRNFGKASVKSDIYSFGILLLEMVGGRKNIDMDATNENSTQVYYPEWIYNLLEQGEDLRIHFEEEKDVEIAKKLAIVGLWCIQWHPIDRPSMKFVAQMLEGDGNGLSVPPNPFTPTAPKSKNGIKAQRQAKLNLEIIPELD